MDFLNNLLSKGKTQFHVIREAMNYLSEKGFTTLSMDSDWELRSGGKYMVSPYSSTLVAFVMGEKTDTLRLSACHTDFPMLKLKPQPEITKKKYMQVNVEPYGGLIISSWFDRPLGLAGKVVTKGEDIFSPRTHLIDSEKPIFIIPNLAPHLKKDSKTGDIDIQKELVPITGCDIAGNMSNSKFIMDYIAEKLDITVDDILDYDLYLYICDQPTAIGLTDEFISSPRLDNLSSVSAILEGLTAGNIKNSIAVGAFFDNEEIGSRSKQGADSLLLKEIIDRIIPNRSYYTKAFNISLDVAHATHPNYQEKSDITNDILLGGGIVLKTSASQRYVTDSEAGAVVTALCRENSIKLQKQVNRSGMPGGQTLGPIMSSYLPIKSVDMGIPMLAMHSARELIHKNDYIELANFIAKYYEY
ncbi:MAG: M18 family aminopeptidase [Lachnospiraceae bacterium]|nr:M18 family aminopeptidase [Lachnospiraceae bacterium]